MIFKTMHFVNDTIISEAEKSIPLFDFKLTLNQPTGEFFYDPWIISDRFKGTIWDKLLKTLPQNIGEARLIMLTPCQSYQTHSDIDDRYQLNLTGNDNSYMINLDSKEMFEIKKDNYGYYMDTSYRHTAANFGYINRIQLVVRNLLIKNHLIESISIKIKPNIESKDRARFIFDDKLSPWLNIANKTGIINNFQYQESVVSFNVEFKELTYLLSIIPKEFKIEHI